MLSQRSHSLPSTSPKGDRTLFPQPNPNAIAFGTSEAYRTFSPQPNLNAIASLLFNPTQTRSHSIPEYYHSAIAQSPLNLTQTRLPSAQAKLIALSPLNLTQTRLPSAQAKLIALSPFNLTQTRSHPFSSTQSPRDRTPFMPTLPILPGLWLHSPVATNVGWVELSVTRQYPGFRWSFVIIDRY